MSDVSFLDLPTEVDPVEEADKLIDELRMCGWLPPATSRLFQALLNLREHLRNEHGY